MEGLVLCPPPPLSSLQQLDMTATSSPKSCLPVFSVSLSVSAVRSGSGGLAGAQHDRKACLVDRGPGVCVWDLIGKFSQQKGRDEGPACMRGPPWVSPHRKKKKGEKKSYWPWFTRQEEKKKKTTNGGGDMQHTRASGFFFSSSSFFFSFFFFFCCCCCAGCVRLDLWAGNEASLCVCGF